MVTAIELGYKPGEAVVREGRYNEERPILESAGYRLITPHEVLRKRLEELTALPRDKEWKESDLGPWNSNDFDTNMGVIVTKDCYALDDFSAALRKITPKTPLVEGGIVLPEIPATAEQFSTRPGRFGHSLGSELALPYKEHEMSPQNEFWRYMAGADEELLRDFFPLMFKALRDVYHIEPQIMANRFGFLCKEDRNTQGKIVERALRLNGFDYMFRSFATDSHRHLDWESSRLVGIRRDAIGAHETNKLDEKVLSV